MTKKEYCKTHPAIASYIGLNGICIHGVEYGIEDYLYVSSGWFCVTDTEDENKVKYHKLKIDYVNDCIYLYNRKIPLNECIKTIDAYGGGVKAVIL